MYPMLLRIFVRVDLLIGNLKPVMLDSGNIWSTHNT
jgi:hypothetical protein